MSEWRDIGHSQIVNWKIDLAWMQLSAQRPRYQSKDGWECRILANAASVGCLAYFKLPRGKNDAEVKAELIRRAEAMTAELCDALDAAPRPSTEPAAAVAAAGPGAEVEA